MWRTITGVGAGQAASVCQQVEDDVFCREPVSNTCETCKKKVCDLHTRWHRVSGVTDDVPLCTSCEAYRLRTEVRSDGTVDGWNFPGQHPQEYYNPNKPSPVD